MIAVRVLALISPLLLAVLPALAQETNNAAAAADMAKRRELHRKFSEISAQARQEEPLVKAFDEATKAYQKADLMLLRRIKQLDPSLSAYVDERIRRYHRGAAEPAQ